MKRLKRKTKRIYGKMRNDVIIVIRHEIFCFFFFDLSVARRQNWANFEKFLEWTARSNVSRVTLITFFSRPALKKRYLRTNVSQHDGYVKKGPWSIPPKSRAPRGGPIIPLPVWPPLSVERIKDGRRGRCQSSSHTNMYLLIPGDSTTTTTPPNR